MKIIYLHLGLLCGLAVVGCGGSDDPRTFHPVAGSVTFNGSPLKNASVVFIPKEGAVVAIGRTDETGHYQLKTQGNDGAVKGEYTVTITATEQTKDIPADAESLTAAQRAELFKSLIPAKYGDAKKSGLSATVTAGEENTIDFDLKG